MIQLDYRLDTYWNYIRDSSLDLCKADEGDLRYYALPADIIFKIDGCDFSAKGFIPVIDFAASMHHVVKELVDNENVDTIFDFTESEATLRFQSTDGAVTISASYATGQAKVPIREFSEAVEAFSHRLVENIKQEFPSLLQNKVFLNLLDVS